VLRRVIGLTWHALNKTPDRDYKFVNALGEPINLTGVSVSQLEKPVDPVLGQHLPFH